MNSKNYKTWKATIDLKTCLQCRNMQGKIYLLREDVYPYPPLHPGCRCIIDYLKAIVAGMATNKGEDGADWWIMNFGELPNYYITKKKAEQLGWNSWFGNLAQIAPGCMITRGVYQNRDGHLPMAKGRIYYEADINYTQGFRGTERIVFSNDGLIFVTYDHYKTFYEIV